MSHHLIMMLIIEVTFLKSDDFKNTPSAYDCHPSCKEGNVTHHLLPNSPLYKRGA